MFNLSEFLHIADGMVVGPAWTDHQCRELLRALRGVRAAAPDSPEESDADVAVAARIFHEVLTLHPAAVNWPLFSGNKSRPSLFKSAVLHALDDPDLSALLGLSDEEALLAENVSRWMLQLPQQTSPALVFSSPPSPASARPKARRKYATAREVAVA